MKDFKEPGDKGHTAKIGKMEVRITQAGARWSEAGIRVSFTSDSDWLLHPEEGETGREPSTADKVLDIIKQGLTDKKMYVIDDDAPQEGPGGRRDAKALKTQVMHNFHSGDDGVLVRVEKGDYQGGGLFTPAVIAKEANEIIDRLALMMKDTHGAQDTADAIDRLHHKIGERGTAVSQYLPPLPVAKDGEALELRMALLDRLPPKYFTDSNARVAAIDEITAGVLGTESRPAWSHAGDESEQGRERDPLRNSIDTAINSRLKPDTTQVMRNFMIGEAVDAAYAALGQRSDLPPH